MPLGRFLSLALLKAGEKIMVADFGAVADFGVVVAAGSAVGAAAVAEVAVEVAVGVVEEEEAAAEAVDFISTPRTLIAICSSRSLWCLCRVK